MTNDKSNGILTPEGAEALGADYADEGVPTPKTIQLRPWMGTRKTAPLQTYRRLTREEIMALRPGDHVWAWGIWRIGGPESVREMKINGKLRTWKTQPDRVEIPCKYGFRECCTMSLSEALEFFVTPLEAE